MRRMRLTWLLATAAIVGALSCSSSEPGQETAKEGTAVGALAVDSCSTCLDVHLGDYNLFLLEDYGGGCTVGGKVAVGGNISMNGFSVGSQLPDDNLSNALVAGGDLALKACGFRGDAWYGGSYTYDTSVVCGRPDCTATKGAPIDFAARFAELRSLSSRLATQPANGTTRFEYGVMYLNGADPCLNVFEANTSDLTSLWQWNFQVPAGSFVVLNLRGPSPTFPGGVEFNGSLTAQRVLYNVVDATTFTLHNTGFSGTLLAPNARITVRDGGWSGGIYAVSMSCAGGFSLDNNPLDKTTGGAEETCNGVDDNCDGRVDEGCTALKDDGAACGGALECASGACVDGVCCNTACAGECDACNLAGLVGTCSMAPSTVQCRASGGECDVAEYCTGSSAACPANGYQASGAACTNDGNACTGDVCNGTGSCHHPPVPAGTSCGSGMTCTAAGVCGGGGSSECVIGGVHYAAGTTNPAAACQVCDPSVSTSSWSPKASGAACTSDGNACTSDVCNGAGTCGHPPVSTGTSCGSGKVCSAAGACGSACWIDGAYYAAGTTNPAADCQVCTPSVSTTSWSFKPASTVCRGASGTCDAAEFCTGSSATCPADAKQPPTTLCRSPAGVCDVAEYCTGSSDTCPGNGYAPSTMMCGSSGDGCQVPAYCTGAGPSCPSNGSKPYGTACVDDGNVCTSDMCNGSGGCSHPPVADGISCGSGLVCTAGVCGIPPNQCLIGGVYYLAGTTNPGADCQVCDPSVSARSWSAKAYGTACTNDGNACTSDMCNGAGSCTHSPVPTGSWCGSGMTCTSAGTCVGAASCPASSTLSWTQWQPSWNGNTGTEGTYVCYGSVSAASDGATVTATQTDSIRTGSARYTCNNGSWVLQSGSCDGKIVSTTAATGLSMTCFSPDPLRAMLISWYMADLKRCADNGGLDSWVNEYNNSPACQASTNYDGYGSKDLCFHVRFIFGAGQSNEYNQAQAAGHIASIAEANACGSLAYPWASVAAYGTNCKYKP